MAAVKTDPSAITSPLPKLSDVFYASGDLAKEREYREMVYRSLGVR